jgi:uncharacterized protein (DUF1499 family)
VDEVDAGRTGSEDGSPQAPTRRASTGRLVLAGVLGVGAAAFVVVMVLARLADPVAAGVQGAELGPCDDVEDCVNSRASDETHAVMPLVCPEAELTEVVAVAESELAGTELERQEGDYAHLVTRRPVLGFAHDLELRSFGSIVDVRAASRTDWFGGTANRDRVEELRSALVEAETCTS